MPIRERVVLITGATGSIGQPLAEAFAAAGARLALVVRRRDAVYALERDLTSRGVSAFVVPCDLRYEEDVVRMIHRVARKFGQIDLVVNAAAATGPREALEDYPIDPWRNVMATNVTGAFLVCREALPWMRRQGGGCIINVTSGVSNTARANWGAYLVSQHAVNGLTRLLKTELKNTTIAVHTVDSGLSSVDGKPAAGDSGWIGSCLRLARQSLPADSIKAPSAR